MQELLCSNPDCNSLVLGRGVLLADDLDLGLPVSEQFKTYDHVEGKAQIILLHPNCFIELFNEFMRQENQTILRIVIGGVDDIDEIVRVKEV